MVHLTTLTLTFFFFVSVLKSPVAVPGNWNERTLKGHSWPPLVQSLPGTEGQLVSWGLKGQFASWRLKGQLAESERTTDKRCSGDSKVRWPAGDWRDNWQLVTLRLKGQMAWRLKGQLAWRLNGLLTTSLTETEGTTDNQSPGDWRVKWPPGDWRDNDS